MKVDRQRFLLLTAVVAASSVACTRIRNELAGRSDAAADQPVAAAAPPAPPSPATTDAGPTPSAEALVDVSTLRDAAASATTKPAVPFLKPSAYPPADLDACKFYPPTGPTCEGNYGDYFCKKSKKNLEPETAKRVAQCFAKKNGTPALCDVEGYIDLYRNCLAEALVPVIPDPDTLEKCEAAVKSCQAFKVRSYVPVAQCQRALTALLPPHRKQAEWCFGHGCNLGCGYGQ